MRSTDSFLRQLQRLKGTRTITGTGVPSRNDGREGDFVLRKTQNGVKLYAKFSGKWYGFSPDSDREDENIVSTDDANKLKDTGSMTLTNGVIIQWGKEACAGLDYKLVTYPIEFPNKCVNVQLTATDADTTGTPEAIGVHASFHISPTNFTANVNSSWVDFYWLAIGN